MIKHFTYSSGHLKKIGQQYAKIEPDNKKLNTRDTKFDVRET
jgi:hypothetical protein